MSKYTDIESLISPENKLEKRIVSDPIFAEGVRFGKPRSGHPEGMVINHIIDVLKNVDALAPESISRYKLRLITLFHDTCKFKVNTNKPKIGDNHHAVIARHFAEKYIDDISILDIIELHDEAYLSWRNGYYTGNWHRAESRLNTLIDRLGDNLELYTLFYRADNNINGKSREPLVWFETKLTLL